MNEACGQTWFGHRPWEPPKSPCGSRCRRNAHRCSGLFLTPTFVLACERANGRAYVAVLHERGAIRGFFPFQFRSGWHQRLRLAERVGGMMSDAAGVVAADEVRISAVSLLRQPGLSALEISRLVPGQEHLGQDAHWPRVGYVIDLGQGPVAYFATLQRHNRTLVRDTERRIPKAESADGVLQFARMETVPPQSPIPGRGAELT